MVPKTMHAIFILAAVAVVLGAQEVAAETGSRTLESTTSNEAVAAIPRIDVDTPPICFAAALGDLAKLQSELRNGISFETADTVGRTALYFAAAFDHPKIVSLLLARGAKPDLPDRCGQTALHVAADRGSREVVTLLLGAGADANSQTSFGETPLMNAAMNGDVVIARALLAAGAKREIRGDDGRTALDWARAAMHPSMVALLQSSSRTGMNRGHR